MATEEHERIFEFQDSLDLVFENSLVVSKVCSFLPAVQDLLNFRSISRLSWFEATKLVRERHQPVELSSDDSMTEFLDLMQTRNEPGQEMLFPFVKFKLNLNISMAMVDRFRTEVGVHVQSLSFGSAMEAQEWKAADAQSKVILLLSGTPNLRNLELTSPYEIHVSDEDLLALPMQFLQLRQIHLEHLSNEPSNVLQTAVPLISVLITRSARLDNVYMQMIEQCEHPGHLNNIYKLLQEYHCHHLPLISLKFQSSIHPSDLPLLEELTRIGFRFKNISIVMLASYSGTVLTEAEIRELVRGVSIWLAAQSSTLTKLSIEIWKPKNWTFFVLPPLKALQELEIINKAPNFRGFTLIAPLVTNQFPVLRKISLESYADGLGTFHRCQFPSVRELYIKKHSTRFTDPWHTTFPNLTAVYYQVHFIYSEDDLPNVAFLLTHFPRLKHLSLNLKPGLGGPSRQDFWDVFTGGAVKPPSSEDALHGPVGEEAGELEFPADAGVYRVSSLNNLRDLKTLHCRLKSRVNLDAIVYMTRAGLLVPLEKITLHGIGQDFPLEEAEKTAYRSVLTQVHAVVDMDRNIQDN